MSSMQPRPVVRPSNGQWNADDAADRLVTEEDLAKRNDSQPAAQITDLRRGPDVNQLPPMPQGEPAKRPNTNLVPAPTVQLPGFGWGERRQIEKARRAVMGRADLLAECYKAGQVSLRMCITPDGQVWGELHCLLDGDGMLQSEHVATIVM